MGGAEPPYIYEPMPGARRSVAYPYSDFNPRAATQAQYATLAERAERQRRRAAQSEKPLVNFNQHPDSYMIVGQQNVSFEPMSPNTRKVVNVTRWTQLAFRCIEEIVAIGLLVCMICLKMPLNSIGWISRIAPAWDIFVTIYAIYHLIRPAKARTPASSASYHFFALFMDTSLIPFYIFIALCANQNRVETAGTDGQWTSVFSDSQSATELIMLAFIGSAVMAGLHLVSIGLDFHLIVVFRRIARLPPDMNPLEENLTSRRPRSTRHKHKNSEATIVPDSAEPMSEKKQHYLSGSTLSVDRLSRVSTAKGSEARTMPFGHSRMNSDNSFSPHNPETARWSRQQFEDAKIYEASQSMRDSRPDPYNSHHTRTGSSSPSKRSTFVENDHNQHQSFQSCSYPFQSVASPLENPNPALSNAVAKSQQKEHLLNDNWYILHDDDEAHDLGTARFPRDPVPSTHEPPSSSSNSRPHPHERHDSFNPQPLRMNPPTPPLADPVPDPEPALYSSNIPNPHPTSSPVRTTPKGKYYGDLAAATRGVRGAAATHIRGGYGIPPPTPEASRSPSPVKRKEKEEEEEERKRREKRRSRGHREGDGQERGQSGGKDARVVSRTGADIGEAFSGAHAPGQGPWAGMRGRREVSGKVVEEGRGGI